MKKVYVVRDCGGRWEDSWSFPVKASLEKEEAEKFKLDREKSMPKKIEEMQENNEKISEQINKIWDDIDSGKLNLSPALKEKLKIIEDHLIFPADPEWSGCELEEIDLI